MSTSSAADKYPPELCRDIVASRAWLSRVAKGTEVLPGVEGVCWLWSGSVDRRTNYGSYRELPVHRVALVASLGRPIGPDKVAGHRCHDIAVELGRCRPGACIHRRCVNPAHVAEMTTSGNSMILVGRGAVQESARDLYGGWTIC